MEDFKIVDLYWDRNEAAISESEKKYGKMLRALSLSLLSSREAAEECVNDTYLDAWNAMPTARPTYLGAFLSKITRRISVDRFRSSHRQKRGGMENLTQELSECIPHASSVEEEYEQGRLAHALDSFLSSLEKEKRVIFIRRYYFGDSISAIAARTDLGEANVKVILHRLRESLRKFLEERELL